MSWIDTVVQAVSSHRDLAYAFVFLIALIESLPLVGLFVPGSTLIVGAAILVPAGALSLLPLLVSAVAGSVTGDTASFWLGRRYGKKLFLWGPLGRRPELVAQGERFFRRHGGKGIIFGRFTPPLRGIVPALGGTSGIGWPRFLAAAAVAALVWAPAHILPGALIGASLQLAGAVTARLGTLLLVLMIAGYLLLSAVSLLLRRGIPAGARMLRRLLLWARAHDNPIGREIVALLDPHHREAGALAVLAGLLIFGGWIFFGVLEDLVSGDPLVRADAAIFHALQALRTPWGDIVMVAVTELGDARVTVPVAAAGLLWLVWRRAWIHAAYWIGAIGFAQIFAAIVKLSMHTPRPNALYEGWSAFSFPSGHATVNGVLYGFLAVLVARRAGPVARTAIAGSAALLIGLIGFSRLYLGAHWFSDVAGGLAFGAAWVGLLGIAHIRHRPADVRTAGLLPVVAAALVLAGSVNIATRHDADMARYRTHPEIVEMDASAWPAGAWRSLPAWRVDLSGEIEEPFVLQWAGTPEELTRRVADSGWRVAMPWTVASAAGWLTGAEAALLPALPKLHDGRRSVLMLVRPAPNGDGRLVLRLWDAQVRLASLAAPVPLWLGTVTTERLYRPLGLLTLTVTGADANGPRDMLVKVLPGLRVARLDIPAGAGAWDGELLLAGQIALAPG